MKNILENIPKIPFTPPVAPEGYTLTDANLGVLFSGGLDSTLLAGLAAALYPQD